MSNQTKDETPEGVKWLSVAPLNQSAEIDKLAAALIEAQAELTPVPRNETNPFYQSKYAAFETCVKHASPVLTKHGLAVIAVGEPSQGNKCVIATMLLHKSGQWIRGVYEATPTKNDPQGYGSALTYLKRYGYCAMTGLPTEGEDDDANVASASTTETHRPTREYEIEPPKNKAAANADLVTLLAWLTENNIPAGFLLAMLKEKQLVAANLQQLANAPAGVIRRCLSAASQRNLIAAYKATLPNEPKKDKPAPKMREVAKPERKTAEPEMDQSIGAVTREPVISGIDAEDYLLQEGYKDWRPVRVHFGKNRGVTLGELATNSLSWYIREWTPKPHPKTKRYSEPDVLLDCALIAAQSELGDQEEAGDTGGGYDG